MKNENKQMLISLSLAGAIGYYLYNKLAKAGYFTDISEKNVVAPKEQVKNESATKQDVIAQPLTPSKPIDEVKIDNVDVIKKDDDKKDDHKKDVVDSQNDKELEPIEPIEAAVVVDDVQETVVEIVDETHIEEEKAEIKIEPTVEQEVVEVVEVIEPQPDVTTVETVDQVESQDKPTLEEAPKEKDEPKVPETPIQEKPIEKAPAKEEPVNVVEKISEKADVEKDTGEKKKNDASDKAAKHIEHAKSAESDKPVEPIKEEPAIMNNVEPLHKVDNKDAGAKEEYDSILDFLNTI